MSTLSIHAFPAIAAASSNSNSSNNQSSKVLYGLGLLFGVVGSTLSNNASCDSNKGDAKESKESIAKWASSATRK